MIKKTFTIICFLIIIGALGFQFILGLDFALNRKSAIATVIKKEEKEKIYLTLSYFNEYHSKANNHIINIYYDVGESINIGDKISIEYQKNFPNVYCEYNTPPTVTWLIITLLLSLLSIYGIISQIRKKNLPAPRNL